MKPFQPISEAWVESHKWWKIGFLFFIVWAAIDYVTRNISKRIILIELLLKCVTVDEKKNLENHARAQDCQWCIRVRKVKACCCCCYNESCHNFVNNFVIYYKLLILPFYKLSIVCIWREFQELVWLYKVQTKADISIFPA